MNIYTHEFIRMQALDKCFRDDTRIYFIDDLIIACNKAVQEHYPKKKNFKKRIIYGDIKKMRSLEGLYDNIKTYLAEDSNLKEFDYIDPVDVVDNKEYYVSKRRKTAYKYLDKNLGLQQLNKIESTQIKDAISVMSRIKGRSEYRGLNEIILKLESDLLDDKHLPTIMSYDDNKLLEGLEHLDDIIEGIKNEEALKIIYQPYGLEPEEIIIYPYYLKQYNKRWFLFANRKNSNELNYIPIFTIDRIKMVTPCHPEKEPFKILNANIEEYLKNVIGVSTSFNHQPESVFLKFQLYRYNYVKSKPLHHSQKSNDADSMVQLRVVLNRELEQLILSFGSDVKVIAPITLKKRIAIISGQMNKQYENERKNYL